MFTKQRFSLFFSLPLDGQDFANLDASGVKLVMMPLSVCVARPAMLGELARRSVRLALRVEEETYYDDAAPASILAGVNFVRQAIPVEAVFVGNEPENAQNLAYGSATFGQPFAYVHRRRFDLVRVALQRAGYQVISPGYTCRMLTEDDPPQPGEITWREICALPQDLEGDQSFGYLDADGNGGHVYTHNFVGPVDRVRIRTIIQRLQTMWHKPLWIDELGVKNAGGQLDRMRHYLEIGDMLLDRRLPYGGRVEMLCPFVANGDPGNPPAWPPEYLMRDPECYRILGAWMAA